MSAQKLLGLPPISSELKPIIPFLQRAEELKEQDPVVAYWCAYYAAQVGISLKARDNHSRDALFSLLGVLEKMKTDIGNVDAIEVEAVSAAYVENFALKIFQSADNEDRRGTATRSTARKFLAASNFLEVLKTFPKADVSESNEERIRYAKWKASDIAKALREGRRPTPGPADQEIQPLEGQFLPDTGITAAPRLGEVDVAHTDSNSSIHLPSLPTTSNIIPYPPKNAQGHHRSGSGSSTHSMPGSSPQKAGRTTVSEEMEGKVTPPSSPPRPSAMKSPGREGSPEGKKRVHFSSSADVVPPIPPLPPKAPSPSEVYQGPPSIYAPQPESGTPLPPIPPTAGSPPRIHPVAPPPSSSYSPPRTTNIYAPPAQPSNHTLSSSPPRSQSSDVPSPPRSGPTAVPPSRPVELTPSLISKVQKHCRFAISSLDYEDAEQAKKELRTALALLGGI